MSILMLHDTQPAIARDNRLQTCSYPSAIQQLRQHAFDSLTTKVLGKAACTPDVLGKSYDNLSCTIVEQRHKAAQSVFKAFRQGS